MFDYTENVKAGIALLDERAPKNWREKVVAHGALTQEAMVGTSTCILGRIYGDLSMNPLGVELERYGFNATRGSGRDGFGLLADAWNTALNLEPANVG